MLSYLRVWAQSCQCFCCCFQLSQALAGWSPWHFYLSFMSILEKNELVPLGFLWTWYCWYLWGQSSNWHNLSQSPTISLEKLWRRVLVTARNYLQQREIQNRMRRERHAMTSGYTVNSSVFKVEENQRWEKQKENTPSGLKKLEEMTGKKDFFSFIRLLLLEECKWRVSPAEAEANGFKRIRVQHVEMVRCDTPDTSEQWRF